MTCNRSRAESPEGKKYCGDCGAPFDSDTKREDSDILWQVQAVIKEYYKEQKFVEMETTQAIAARLMEWSKMLGFAVAIPFGLLAIIFAVLGISDYRSFNEHVNKSIDSFDKKVVDVQKSLDAKVAAATQGADASLAQSRQLSCASGEPLLAAHATIAAWPKGGVPWPDPYPGDPAASRTGGKSSPVGSEVVCPSGRSAGPRASTR